MEPVLPIDCSTNSRFHSPVSAGSTVDSPLVSILCPVYNCERYLDKAVRSVLAQEYPYWELLLCDDASVDSSWSRILEWSRSDERIIALHHPQHVNLGLGATRNLGMSQARGEYFACLDPDDEWLPHKLIRQIDVMRKYPDVGLVYSQALCVDENSEPLTTPRSVAKLMGVVGHGFANRPIWAYEYLVADQGVWPPCPTVMVRGGLVRKCGGFQAGLRYMVEDKLLWTRIARLAPIYFIPEVLALYRFSAENFTSRQTRTSIRDRDWEYVLTLARTSGGADSAMSRQAARMIDNLLSPSLGGRVERLEMIASELRRVLADRHFGFSGKLSVLMRLTLEALPLGMASAFRHRARSLLSGAAGRTASPQASDERVER